MTALSGCSGKIIEPSGPDVSWPPRKPAKVPDKNEVPDLPQPTWDDSGAPKAFIYYDMATKQAGSLFNQHWEGIKRLIKQEQVQVSLCDYPLPWNEWSYPVAIASRSVQYHAGNDAFLLFAQRVLRDYRPDPYTTKKRVLDAAEEAGASRDIVRKETEDWRFYPVVENYKRYGEQLGIDNSVPAVVVVNGDKKSTTVPPSPEHIELISQKMSGRNMDT